MNKRVKLSREQKVLVRKWIDNVEYGDSILCPFESIRIAPHYICNSWFPKTNAFACPCHIYKLSTVIKRAKEMLK